MSPVSPQALDVLRLTLLPNVGPVLIGRLLSTFGSTDAIWRASRADLERIPGIGAHKSASIVNGRAAADELAQKEEDLAHKLGVCIAIKGEPRYPKLLASLPDAPPLLYIRGTLEPLDSDRFTVGIVGSRRCSQYGLEQAARFAGVLAQAGLTVVSGGAKGIDSAAHRGAIRAGGRTVAVLGCGLAECYPPENAELFDEIAKTGALISELPLQTGPTPENFPARNRLISGLSLGVLVIEASERSGALITARLAAEDHGREVMAVPGRVDSPFSQGCLQLLKGGGAQLVTDPGDVILTLEQAGFHQHAGTHESRYMPHVPSLFNGGEPKVQEHVQVPEETRGASTLYASSDFSKRVLRCLYDAADAITIEELANRTGLELSQARAVVTLLEIQKRVARDGTRIRKV